MQHSSSSSGSLYHNQITSVHDRHHILSSVFLQSARLEAGRSIDNMKTLANHFSWIEGAWTISPQSPKCAGPYDLLKDFGRPERTRTVDLPGAPGRCLTAKNWGNDPINDDLNHDHYGRPERTRTVDLYRVKVAL